MARPNKKLSVTPERRKKWLERHDVEGESTIEIAKKDFYDIRTVRRQLDVAREERELREGRLMVLRDALESHYKDLCEFAQQIDDTITASNSLSILMSERKYSALKQHLPYSPLWKRLDKWNSSYLEREKALKDLIAEIEDILSRDSKLKQVFFGVKTDFSEAARRSAELSIQSTHSIRFDVDVWIKNETIDNGLNRIKFGAYPIGIAGPAYLPTVKKVFDNIARKIPSFETFKTYQKIAEEMKLLESDIHEDLATITLKRVVPGRCKYCPA